MDVLHPKQFWYCIYCTEEHTHTHTTVKCCIVHKMTGNSVSQIQINFKKYCTKNMLHFDSAKYLI